MTDAELIEEAKHLSARLADADTYRQGDVDDAADTLLTLANRLAELTKPTAVPAVIRDFSASICKSGSEVSVFCDDDASALELFDWLERGAAVEPTPWRSVDELPNSWQVVWVRSSDDDETHVDIGYHDGGRWLLGFSPVAVSATGWQPIVRPSP